MTLRIDLNCDMGESYGAWKMGNDDAILPFVSSANIACGFHGGDPATMRKTVAAALKNKVGLGAHPGLPDLQGFGRRDMKITDQEAYDMMVVQIGALAAVAASQGAKLQHVKAHGQLYNMAVKNEGLTHALAQATYDVDKNLVFFGLAASNMISIAEKIGLTAKSEVFGDRTYQADGTLTPRTQAGAMITDVKQTIAQVLQMIKTGTLTAQDGTVVKVRADTLCIHGDQPGAVEFAKAIRVALQTEGIQIGF